MELYQFLAYLIVFYCLHSLLASNAVKQKLQSIIPSRFYRLVYNAFAIGLLVLVALLYVRLETELLFTTQTITNIIAWFFLIAGGILNLLSIRQYNLSEFAGFQQLKTKEESGTNQLNIKGLNAYVRHPLYTTALMILFGLFLLIPSKAHLGLLLISWIYVLIGIKLEEVKLVDEFGDAYRTYQKQVPMLLPNLK